jgi:hypothetical protein
VVVEHRGGGGAKREVALPQARQDVKRRTVTMAPALLRRTLLGDSPA